MKVITIGRSQDNDICINDSQVSRYHCQIVQYDNDTFAIVDLDSFSGTFVNGIRINDNVTLKLTDSVNVGGIPLQWQAFFRTKKTAVLPILVGVGGGIFVMFAFVAAFFLINRINNNNSSRTNREFYIGGVNLGFDMNQDDLFKENPKARITAKRTGEKQGASLPPHDYFLINNNVAVTFVDSPNVQESNINQIVVWQPDYTINNICVNDPFSKLMNEYNVNKSTGNYGTLSFWYFQSWFDYRSESFTGAICVYDEATCTGYLLFQHQFSASLWQNITAASGNVEYNGEISFELLSLSIYQAICSSVTISQIIKYNCANKAQLPFVKTDAYVDLGLPSGTLWKSRNENRWYTYNGALLQYGDKLPSKEQMEELVNYCRWTWIGNGYRVDGPNGNFIVLPVSGYQSFSAGESGCGEFHYLDEAGYYWTSTAGRSRTAWFLNFYSQGVNVDNYEQSNEYSVRLVNGPATIPSAKNNNNFPYDAFGSIPYNSDMFDYGSSGVVSLSNGDCLQYTFRKDMDFFPTWSIEFSMAGGDISNKYKVAALQTLDAEKGYVGEDDDNRKIIITISVGGFTDIGVDKLFIIVKYK